MGTVLYNSRLAQTIIQKLNARQMEGYYCATKEEALAKALELMPKGSSIGWGGSQSVKEIGLMEAIKENGYVLYDRKNYTDKEEKMAMYAKILCADWFLMSTNAMTMDGILVNIDGRSDRVSFLCFGPENVLVIVGMNKICADLDSAVSRARNIAAPQNALKLDREVPCRESGKCSNCLAKECICSQVLITRRSAYKNRIKVILVGEDLGF